MNTAQRILKNFLFLSGAEILVILLGFIAIPYLARVLGPNNFGRINFAFALVSYFILFSNLGLEMLGTRELARNKERIKEYVGNIIALRLILSFLTFGLLLLFATFLNQSPQTKHLIILYGLMLFPSVLLFGWVFQGIERMEYIGASRILTGVLYTGSVLWLIKSPRQLLWVPGIQVSANLFAVGFLIFIFIRHFGIVRLRFNLSLWKHLVLQALPIGLTGAMSLVIYNIDTVMLGFMRTNEEVGYYNAAYKIVLLLIGLVATYYNAIFPVASHYYETSLDSLKKLQSYTAKLMIIVSLPLAIGGTILAKPIINLIYGTKYEPGVIGFQILIWAVFLIYVNSNYSRGLLACDRQKRVLGIVTFQAAIILILNFILIPLFGLTGAAITTVFGEICGFLMYYFEFGKIVRIPIHNYILKPFVASTIMGVFLRLCFNWNLFLLILIGTAIYFVFLYLMRGVTPEEIGLLRNAILKR